MAIRRVIVRADQQDVGGNRVQERRLGLAVNGTEGDGLHPAGKQVAQNQLLIGGRMSAGRAKIQLHVAQGEGRCVATKPHQRPIIIGPPAHETNPNFLGGGTARRGALMVAPVEDSSSRYGH